MDCDSPFVECDSPVPASPRRAEFISLESRLRDSEDSHSAPVQEALPPSTEPRNVLTLLPSITLCHDVSSKRQQDNVKQMRGI